MTTREEMWRAIVSSAKQYNEVVVTPHGGDVESAAAAQAFFRSTGRQLDEAAHQIERDGALRKRLKVLSTGWRNSPESLTEKDCADELDLVVEELE